MLKTLRILRKHALHVNLNEILHLVGKGPLPSYHSNQTIIPCQIISKIVKFEGQIIETKLV